MTTKPPSGLAASGPVDEPDITKEHNDDDDDQGISVDPSEDVTVEATEDVTTEAASSTPHPTLLQGAVGGTPIPRPAAPTLLGVPIQSLPLPGVTAASAAGNGAELSREIDYDEEITVLANPAPADPLAKLDAKFDALEAGLDALDRPSITDDDEEETKVEPAEAAMKAAETSDDVTTALSAQASLEREKALRRSVSPSPSDDLEFADPEADEEEEESLDDELDDGDEVISAGGAIEEEEDVDDADDGENDGVATATFMKPVDSTGLSGLLNPRRPPSGFGQARLPTPYPPPQVAPAPSTSPFASRLGPAPTGSPYARPTGASMPAIQIPAPSGKATTESKPGYLNVKLQVPAVGLIALVGGCLIAGYSIGALTSKKSGPTVIVAKPTAPPAAPAAPVVEPVTVTGVATVPAEAKPAVPTTPAVAKSPEVTPPAEKPNAENPEEGLWKQPAPPAAKKPVVAKARKPPAGEASDEEPTPKPKAAVASSPKPVTPKPAVSATPKSEPTTPAPKAKGGKKAASKVWVDPFAN